jgi:hypothetical protein
MLLARMAMSIALVTLPAGVVAAFTPEPGPPIGQSSGPPRPHITSATDRLKAEQESIPAPPACLMSTRTFTRRRR